MERLGGDAVEVTRVRPGEGTLIRAARAPARRIPEVVRLVTERRLAFVGRLAGVIGPPSNVVRLDEVIGLLNGGDDPSRTFFKISRLLRIPYQGVVALVEDGHLATVEARQRRSGQVHDIGRAESLDAFTRDHVSVSCLARRWDAHPHALRSRLAKAGIRSALSVDRHLTPIYRTQDLPEGPPSRKIGP